MHLLELEKIDDNLSSNKTVHPIDFLWWTVLVYVFVLLFVFLIRYLFLV